MTNINCDNLQNLERALICRDSQEELLTLAKAHNKNEQTTRAQHSRCRELNVVWIYNEWILFAPLG